MNTPIHDAAAVEHFLRNAFQFPPEVEPVPQPTRFDAELVVAGIEGKAIVRAGLDPITGGLR